MKITEELLIELIRSAEGVLHHDGYTEKEVQEYAYRNLKKGFRRVLKRHKTELEQ